MSSPCKLSWKCRKVAGQGVGLLLNNAGRHLIHYQLIISILPQTRARRNAPKFWIRKTGKM
ncbi:hypothetical protein NC652_002211 [Populus alba x Populus x berolinensis]|nr:hypothetical protein NC652_002211 [Populus alba x Populus x berolinensis]